MAPDLEWPIDTMPSETAYGPFPGDIPFLTGGIDLFIFGSAWQADNEPGTRLTMDIRVGRNFHRRLAVIGDRYWVGQGNGLVPSEPERFVDMPLTYANAYGGSLDTEEGTANWPANPNGKGFYLDAGQAVGGPLPNLEDPDHLIATFEDRPEPIATAPYPAEGSLRPLNALDLDDRPGKFGIRRIKPTLFNHAHPAMILPPGSVDAGDIVEITHATPEGTLRFALPGLSLEAHVELEGSRVRFSAAPRPNRRADDGAPRLSFLSHGFQIPRGTAGTPQDYVAREILRGGIQCLSRLRRSTCLRKFRNPKLEPAGW